MARMTQERFLDLLKASEMAINKLPETLVFIQAIKDKNVDDILKRAAEKGLTPESEFGQLFLEFEKILDYICDRLREAIPIEAIVILTREKTYFNESRIRSNRQIRDSMRNHRNQILGEQIKDLDGYEIPKAIPVEFKSKNTTPEQKIHSWLLENGFARNQPIEFQEIHEKMFSAETTQSETDTENHLKLLIPKGLIEQIDEFSWRIL